MGQRVLPPRTAEDHRVDVVTTIDGVRTATWVKKCLCLPGLSGYRHKLCRSARRLFLALCSRRLTRHCELEQWARVLLVTSVLCRLFHLRRTALKCMRVVTRCGVGIGDGNCLACSPFRYIPPPNDRALQCIQPMVCSIVFRRSP